MFWLNELVLRPCQGFAHSFSLLATCLLNLRTTLVTHSLFSVLIPLQPTATIIIHVIIITMKAVAVVALLLLAIGMCFTGLPRRA
jgi:hypothetical protein